MISLKSIIILALACTALSLPTHPQSPYDQRWEAYKEEYKKNYSPREEQIRRSIWEKNIEYVENHNYYADLHNEPERMGINIHTDKELHEVTGLIINSRMSASPYDDFIVTYQRQMNVNLTGSVNWTEKGLVTPVRDQGECNSCWAFSTAGALEGQLKMKTGKLDVLSPEQLVDCVYGYGCSQGGNPIEAYNYIMQVGGLEKESDYPYNVNSAHTCKFDKSKALGKIQKVVMIPQGDEEALKEAVATVGPLSICVAANENFKHYKNGVFKKKCGRKINHAVMLVGYGEEDGVGFWLIKNSWGETWGENGYMRLAQGGNHCEVTTLATYPLLEP